jgi:hypothetical protein
VRSASFVAPDTRIGRGLKQVEVEPPNSDAGLRAVLQRTDRPRERRHWMPAGHSLLVEIFLWEGDGDAALAEAKAGGCGDDLWLKLAQAREAVHPEDALPIYQARVERTVALANNRAYDDATGLLKKIRELMQRTGAGGEFTTYLDTVCAKHRAKRNFMQRIEMLR